MTDFFNRIGGDPWKKAENRDFDFLRIWVFQRKIKKRIADSYSAQNFGLEKLFEIFQSEKSRIPIIPLNNRKFKIFNRDSGVLRGTAAYAKRSGVFDDIFIVLILT